MHCPANCTKKSRSSGLPKVWSVPNKRSLWSAAISPAKQGASPLLLGKRNKLTNAGKHSGHLQPACCTCSGDTGSWPAKAACVPLRGLTPHSKGSASCGVWRISKSSYLLAGHSWPVAAMAGIEFQVKVEGGMGFFLSCQSGPRPLSRRPGLARSYLPGSPFGTGSGRAMSASQVQLSCSRCFAP